MLVFTVALRSEIPLIENLPAGVKFIQTGMGLSASQKSAEWICATMKPSFVVNLGTAGSFKDWAPPGSWVAPQQVGSENSFYSIESALPFAIPESFPLLQRGRLLSVVEPKFGTEIPNNWREYDFVDMEASAQAEIFKKAGIPFTVLKRITDTSTEDPAPYFKELLKTVRQEAQELLHFLTHREEPRISVIIPVYNRATWISKTIQSVLNQTHAPQEIIVVDDGSTDETSEILKRFGGLIRVLTLTKNHGVSIARNRGVEIATGDWISFLDSDDQWKPEKLAYQVQFIRENPHYKILQSEEIWIRNGKRVNACDHHAKPKDWMWKPSLERCMISPSSVAMKKSVFMKENGFDPEFPACEDYELWLRLCRKYPIGLESSASLIKYGGHADQLSRTYPAMDRFRVKALMKALKYETDPAYREELLKIIQTKLNILIQGATKRDLQTDLQEYTLLMNSLPKWSTSKAYDSITLQ